MKVRPMLRRPTVELESQPIVVIPGVFGWYYPECLATFPGIFYDIPLNIWCHSPECLAIFPEILGDIHRNVWRHSPKCLRTLPGMFGNIPWNVWRHSPECLRTLPEMFGDIPRNKTFPLFPAFRSPFLYSCFYTLPSPWLNIYKLAGKEIVKL